jgi:hypothetical protein
MANAQHGSESCEKIRAVAPVSDRRFLRIKDFGGQRPPLQRMKPIFLQLGRQCKLQGGREGKFKEMLKMKVDPAMSMKILKTTTNCPLNLQAIT